MTLRSCFLLLWPLGLAVPAPMALAPAHAQSASFEAAVQRGPVPAWVQPAELLDVPEDARGALFFRLQHTEARLTPAGQLTYQAYRVRLLHPSALQLGNLSLTWNPAAGAPVVHTIAIHRGDERIDVLGAHEFEILRRENQLEAAMIDGLLTASLRVPDLRVDDELEVAFTLPGSNPTLRGTESGLLFLADSPPPGRFRLGLSWEDRPGPGLRVTPDMEGWLVRGEQRITILADNPEASPPPGDAPPRYAWRRIVEYSDFPSWNAISARFAPLYLAASQLGEGSAVRREAERIARQHQSPRARLDAAFDLVTRQVRYVYVGLNDGALTPASAEETWQRRFGDCKAKTVLLLALLAQLEIEAEAVLVSNAGLDDALDTRLPNPGLFDHVLVRARIDGETFWLDGTLPPVARPASQPVLPYRWVLPLAREGAALEALPWQPPLAPLEQVLTELDASAGFEEPARIRRISIARGIAALGEYLQFSAATDAQLEAAFRQQMVGSGEWDSLESARWRFDVAQQASVLELVGTGPLDWDVRSNGTRALSLPGGGFSPPPRRQRDPGEDQSAPYWQQSGFSCHVTTVRLPADTFPEQWSFNSMFDTQMFGRQFSRRFERRGQEIRMIRASRVLAQEISAEQARADNARLAGFDNSMARITFDPDDHLILRPGNRVPAVSEVDWVADPSACSGPS